MHRTLYMSTNPIKKVKQTVTFSWWCRNRVCLATRYLVWGPVVTSSLQASGTRCWVLGGGRCSSFCLFAAADWSQNVVPFDWRIIYNDVFWLIYLYPVVRFPMKFRTCILWSIGLIKTRELSIKKRCFSHKVVKWAFDAYEFIYICLVSLINANYQQFLTNGS